MRPSGLEAREQVDRTGGHYLLLLEVDADGKGKMFLVISPSNILIFSDQMILIPRKIAS